jgi:hypothetical protein
LDVSLDVAAVHYADAKKLLGSHSLQDAVAFYLKSQAGIIQKGVADVVAEFIRSKEQGTGGNGVLSFIPHGTSCLVSVFTPEIAPSD